VHSKPVPYLSCPLLFGHSVELATDMAAEVNRPAAESEKIANDFANTVAKEKNSLGKKQAREEVIKLLGEEP